MGEQRQTSYVKSALRLRIFKNAYYTSPNNACNLCIYNHYIRQAQHREIMDCKSFQSCTLSSSVGYTGTLNYIDIQRDRPLLQCRVLICYADWLWFPLSVIITFVFFRFIHKINNNGLPKKSISVSILFNNSDIIETTCRKFQRVNDTDLTTKWKTNLRSHDGKWC